MIKLVHVYDIDGTIVCSLHRYRTLACGTRIDLPYWRENQHKALEDSLLPLADQYLIDCNNPQVFTIIATSRVLGTLDYQFIRDQLGVPDGLVSRDGEGDDRRAFTLKTDGIIAIVKKYGLEDIPLHFWEDNKEVCYNVANAVGGEGHWTPSLQGH